MFLKIVWWVPIVVSLIFVGTLQLSRGAYLRCYGKSIEEYDEVILEQSESILNSPHYNCNLFNFIYTFGFNGKMHGVYTVKVLNALLKLNDRNVFVLNWEREASSITTLGSIGYILSYIVSGLPQSAKVGFDFGRALEKMSDNGFKLSESHAMGLSLGAHIFGNAGRYLIKIGKKISRISGCDPAGAFFDSYFSIMPALDKSCADFVDTTHTDPGGYAMNSSISHLDIWVNHGNFIYGPEENQVQPGCPVGDYEMFSQNDLCSHGRCLELWIQAWAGAKLEAKKASDYWTWNDYVEQGVVTDIVLLGDNTDRQVFGDCYMNTTGSPPYRPPGPQNETTQLRNDLTGLSLADS